MGENNFKEKLKLARSLVYAGAVIILSIPAIQYIFSTRPKRPVREPIEYSRPLDFNRSIDFQPLDINDVRSFGSEPLDFELPEVPAIEPVILDLPTNNITSVLRKGLQGASF